MIASAPVDVKFRSDDWPVPVEGSVCRGGVRVELRQPGSSARLCGADEEKRMINVVVVYVYKLLT